VRGPLSADWWLRDRRYDDGRWTVAQWPNPALIVFVVAVIVRESVLAVVGVTVINEAATYVGRGAMLVFGLDELARGVNPLRRLLGVGVLAWQLSAIVEAGFV
jgi:hypothetical protein